MMRRIGITGKNGFIGYHLFQTLRLFKEEFAIIDFDRSFFENDCELDNFVSNCDVIVHLAALNRHSNSQVIYDLNTEIVKKLIASLDRTQSQAHIIISSSTQEERDNLYGKSKKISRLMLSDRINRVGGRFSGLIIPNVFGPFGAPYYNSVVSTFCHQLSHDELPKIEMDSQLKLIYVGDLVEEIIKAIRNEDNTHELHISPTAEARVSEILNLLIHFKEVYQEKGEFPALNNSFEYKLFNTYRCYMDIANYFPRKLSQHTDNRGKFVEIARHGIAGQTSFSTTAAGVTRGNHFHSRKIERFAVIKGKALIQLRRIGSDEVHDFLINGEDPAYVDIPIWYTHNIKNVGEDILFTIFWINEPFDPTDSDTYFVEV